MSVLNISKLNVRDIVVKTPVKRLGIYNSSLLLKDKPFFLQLSNVCVNTIDNNNFNIELNDKHINALQNLEDFIIQESSNNSKDWFKTELSIKQIKSSFISLISKSNEKSILKLSANNFKVFDKHHNKLEKSDIKSNDFATIIIQCNGINFWSSKISHTMELMQVKKYNNLIDPLFIDSDSD
jgi:hypothetical protein